MDVMDTSPVAVRPSDAAMPDARLSEAADSSVSAAVASWLPTLSVKPTNTVASAMTTDADGDGEAPAMNTVVCDGVCEPERVVDGVRVVEAVTVGDGEGVCEGVCVGVAVSVAVAVRLAMAEFDATGELVLRADCVGAAVNVALPV